MVPLRITAGIVFGFMSGTLAEVRRHQPDAMFRPTADKVFVLLLFFAVMGGLVVDLIETLWRIRQRRRASGQTST